MLIPPRHLLSPPSASRQTTTTENEIDDGIVMH